MASKFHDDWQSSKKTVLQRNAYMFDNELMSDVSFTCADSSRIFHAHKYVLATSSAVFYAMFYGDMAHKESIISLTDAEDESFEEFLRFLYTDDCEITPENAIGVMYLAKKYFILTLAEKCCQAVQASIKPENVFLALKQAVQFKEGELESKCWDVVSRSTSKCTKSKAFCDIEAHILNALLKLEILTITEVDLFKAVLRWVDNECAKQGINLADDTAARRRILGDSVYEIRFLAMSMNDFARYVPPTGILTDAEIISIFQAFGQVDVPNLKWKDKCKRKAWPLGFARFEPDDVATDKKQMWRYDIARVPETADGLTIVANKDVSFYGVRLFGNPDGGQYDVNFTIKGENVTGTYVSEVDSDGVWGYDVMLSKPVSLLSNEEVTIIAKIKGPRSHRGQNGKSSVKSDDIVVKFKNAPLHQSSNYTNQSNGQFYKLFLT